MKKILRSLLLSCLVLAGANRVWANDREMALAVIDKAIKAHGGEDAMARAQIAVRSATGKMSPFGKEVPFADEIHLQLPDRFRINLVMGSGDQKARFLLVVNGDKGWQSTGGMSMELGKERLEELLEEAYVFSLTTYLPLKKDNVFELATLPEIKVNDQPAVGVKVARKGRPDVKLHFDKQSGLLVRIERRAREGGVLVDKEYIYSEHKEFDGIKMATKHIENVNGRKFSDVTVSSYKFPRQADEKWFDKP